MNPIEWMAGGDRPATGFEEASLGEDELKRSCAGSVASSRSSRTLDNDGDHLLSNSLREWIERHACCDHVALFRELRRLREARAYEYLGAVGYAIAALKRKWEREGIVHIVIMADAKLDGVKVRPPNGLYSTLELEGEGIRHPDVLPPSKGFTGVSYRPRWETR